MTRLARAIEVACDIEASYGAGLTGAQTWATAQWIMATTRPRRRIERMNEPRDLYTRVLGASDEIPGPRVTELTFTVELAGSGTAGTPPPWGRLLRACQFAETITVGNRVEYTPVSAPGESLTFRVWEDGVAWIARGARGQVAFDVTAYKRPTATFTFRGFDTTAAQTAWDGPANRFAAWRPPILPQSFNSGNILLGCTLAGGNLSGGTPYPSKGFSLDLGNELTYDAILGGEKVVVTGRNPQGQMLLELSAAQETQWRTEMNDSVETTFGWRVGTGAGNRIAFFGRRLQRQEAQGEDDNGFLRTSTRFGLILDGADPSDDFMRIVVS